MPIAKGVRFLTRHTTAFRGVVLSSLSIENKAREEYQVMCPQL